MAVNFHDNSSYPTSEEDYYNLTNSLSSMLSDLDKVIVSEYNKRDAVKKLKEVEERENLINSMNNNLNRDLNDGNDKNVFGISINNIDDSVNIYEDIPKEYYNTSELDKDSVVVQDIDYIKSISFSDDCDESLNNENIVDDSNIDTDFKLSIDSIDMDEDKIFIINQDGVKDLNEVGKESLKPIITDIDDTNSFVCDVIDDVDDEFLSKVDDTVQEQCNNVIVEQQLDDNIVDENEIHYFNNITKEESNDIKNKFDNIMNSLNKNSINTYFVDNNNRNLFNSTELKSLVDDTINRINKSK